MVSPEFSLQNWEQAGNIFSGLNIGVKAALFLEIARLTRPGTYLPVRDTVDRFRAIFAGTELLERYQNQKSIRGNVIGYCRNSLCDVGLVAADYSLNGKPIGFGVTEEGVKLGVPSAKLVLLLEDEMDQSLQRTLGETRSTGQTRAPLNRARILDYLAKNPDGQKQADLVSALGLEPDNIRIFLETADELRLLEYKRISNAPSGKDTPLQYEWAEQALPLYLQNPLQHRITKAVEGLIEQGQTRFSASEVLRNLPEDIKQLWSRDPLKNRVNRSLSGLARQGVLRRVNDFVGGVKHSDITLYPEGRRIVTNLVWPVLSLAAGSPLGDETLKAMDAVDANLSFYAKRSAELYYPYSNSTKIAQVGEGQMKVIQKLSESQKPLTARELSEQTGIGKRTILLHYLNSQVKGSDEIAIETAGKEVVISRQKIGGVYYYSLK